MIPSNIDVKGIVHPKMEILSLLTIMLFPTRKTFVHLRNIN